VPERGDIVTINFDPSQGSEIKKRRPALVISPKNYNQKVGLALVCPITSHKKGYPFEVELPENKFINGVILADHVKSFDWRIRKVEFVMPASKDIMEETIDKLSAIIGGK
jgi:mRNA interferase MazF